MTMPFFHCLDHARESVLHELIFTRIKVPVLCTCVLQSGGNVLENEDVRDTLKMQDHFGFR